MRCSLPGFLLLFLLPFPFLPVLSAQNADSIVHSITDDYRNDTLNERYDLMIGYWKGHEIFRRVFVFRSGLQFSDSSLVVQTWSPEGKLLERNETSESMNECAIPPPVPVSVFPGYRMNIPMNKDTGIQYFSSLSARNEKRNNRQKNTPPEISEPTSADTLITRDCNSHFRSRTLFSDSMAVTVRLYGVDGDSIPGCDTLWYYPDHSLKAERHYDAGILREARYYSYEKDKEGNPFHTTCRMEDRGSVIVHESFKAFHQGQSYDLYDKWIYDNDSLHFRAFERMYDHDFRQIAYLKYENGEFAGFGQCEYSADGRMTRNTTFAKDSSLLSNESYHWLESKGRVERWSKRESRELSQYNGTYWSRTDTLRNQNHIIVRSWGVKPGAEVHPFKTPPKKIRVPGQYVKYDRTGRTVEVRNTDPESKKATSVTRFSYSR